MPVCAKCLDVHAVGSPDCMAARVGRSVAGRYEVQEMIGVGAMGAVYRAEHLGLRMPVALKMLRRRFARDPQSVERLMREARGTAVVRHPNVVEVRDVGRDEDGTPYIEMELLHGTPGDALTRDGAVDVARALFVVRSALAGLGAAHARGLVHRDIKPANLFVAAAAGAEHVKLLDFGFAKVANAETLTLPGQRLGSPAFMSPEQMRDPSRVDARADLYSMGATLFHLLTGSLPITGQDMSSLFARIMTGEIERHPRALRPDLPTWLDEAVARSLALDAGARFATAEAMHTALAASLS